MNIPLNVDWQQILLHWMNLAILIGGLYFLLYKPVKDFMDKRRDQYRQQEEAAQEKLREAEAAEAACKARLDGLEEELRAERAKSQQAAEAAAGARLAQAEAEAAQIVARARTDAEHAREQIRRESQRELRELVSEAAQKLAFQPGADPLDQFLNQAEGGEAHDAPGR